MPFTENGLLPPRYNEIVQNIEEAQELKIAQKFKYQNNKIIYHLNSIYAAQVDKISALSEAAFNTLKLNAAYGPFLDELGILRGVYRIQATASFTTTQYVWAKPGTTIPTGTLFSSPIQSEKAINTSNIVFNLNQPSAFVLVVNQAIANAEYTITINNQDFSYTAGSSPSKSSIISGLQAEFDAISDKVWSYEIDASDRLTITVDSGEEIIASLQTTYLQVDRIKKYFYVELTETGDIPVPAESMKSIQSVGGILEVNNDAPFILGRNKETDSEFRPRIAAGPIGDCTGTVETIQASLIENVLGVTYASVIENTDEAPTDSAGRPMGSYEVVVLGGQDQDVAQDVWRTKPAGVQIVGNQMEVITDGSGVLRDVHFTRPDSVPFAVRVTYEMYDEEVPVLEREDLMTGAILETVNSLGLDQDLIVSKLYGPIYQSVPTGLGRITVEVQELPSVGQSVNPSLWTEATQPLSAAEYAIATESDIYFEEV